MKKFILCLLVFACTGLHAQLLVGMFNTTVLPTAATPTFSPAAGAVANPTTVTASSATSGSGCTMYEDTNNPPTTAQSTYSVTTTVTLHAQLRGCASYNNSAIASAAYTLISWPFTDNFTRADSSTLGANYTEGWTSGSCATQIGITSGAATIAQYACGGNFSVALITTSGYTFSNNQEVSFTLESTNAASAILILRATDVNNYELIKGSTDSIELDKMVAGVATYIGSFSGGFGSGITYKATAIGSSYTLYANGVSQGSLTDTTWTSGVPGFGIQSDTGYTPEIVTSLSANVCTTTCP